MFWVLKANEAKDERLSKESLLTTESLRFTVSNNAVLELATGVLFSFSF
jgi:hypothetical protein